MAWFLVGDEFYDCPQAIDAGNAAVGLWARAGSWSQKQGTSGFFPLSALPMIGTPAQARRLVDSGLWLPEDGGWLDAMRQSRPPRADPEALRRARSAAGRAGGLASARTRSRRHSVGDRAQLSLPTAREQTVATYESWKHEPGPDLPENAQPNSEEER